MAIVLAIAVAAPELAAPAGAVGPGSTTSAAMQARPAVRAELVAKRRRRKVHKKALRPISAAKKRALLTSFIKTHPGVVAAHAQRPKVTLARKLKLAAYLRLHPKKRIKKRVVHPKPVKPAKKKVAHKKKKKKAAAGASWHRPAELLVGLSIAMIALFLIGSSVFSGPRRRARARARRRHRTLVPR